jgi:hypothetical protein
MHSTSMMPGSETVAWGPRPFHPLLVSRLLCGKPTPNLARTDRAMIGGADIAFTLCGMDAGASLASVARIALRHWPDAVLIGLPLPANAEFDLIAVADPYQFASARELSLFRRPLPTTNIKFDSTVMWDGREVVAGQTVPQEFATQASDAVVGHAQGQPLTKAQRASIVQFAGRRLDGALVPARCTAGSGTYAHLTSVHFPPPIGRRQLRRARDSASTACSHGHALRSPPDLDTDLWSGPRERSLPSRYQPVAMQPSSPTEMVDIVIGCHIVIGTFQPSACAGWQWGCRDLGRSPRRTRRPRRQARPPPGRTCAPPRRRRSAPITAGPRRRVRRGRQVTWHSRLCNGRSLCAAWRMLQSSS